MRLAARSKRIARFRCAAEPSQDMRARRPPRLIIRGAVRIDRLEGRQASRNLAGLRERDGSADLRADGRREAHEALVEQRDFLPVDHAAHDAVRVDRLDGGLELIAAKVRKKGSCANSRQCV